MTCFDISIRLIKVLYSDDWFSPEKMHPPPLTDGKLEILAGGG